MRTAAAYALIFYGVIAMVAIPRNVNEGRMAPAAGLVQAIDTIAMIFAALGVLLGLAWALAAAVATVSCLSLFTAYHAWLLEGRSGLWKQRGRSVLAAALVAMLVFGN